jgi:DNA-binding beta-propeller fold protein YncE
MRTLKCTMVLTLVLLVAMPVIAHAWIRSPATTFATLPAGTSHPEGITVDRHTDDVYVADFEPGGTAGHVVVFSSNGRLLRTLTLTTPTNPQPTSFLLGLDFHPTTGALLVIDFGGSRVLKVDRFTGASTLFMTIPVAGAGLNALAFDTAGNVYVSDSFLGIIWRTGPAGGVATAWKTDPLLTTTGVPPFGANGLAFNNARTALFVANTGNDTVVKIAVTGGTSNNPTAGAATVFVNSINGADGLIIDEEDRIWVCANQADEIVVLDPTNGRVIAKLGDFNGVGPDGAPNGLLFPASLVFQGNFVLVTNLSLDLGAALGDPSKRTVDSPWAAQVTTHTVAKISRHLPPVQGLP